MVNKADEYREEYAKLFRAQSFMNIFAQSAYVTKMNANRFTMRLAVSWIERCDGKKKFCKK